MAKNIETLAKQSFMRKTGYWGNGLTGLATGICLGALFHEKLMPLYQGWTIYLKALQVIALPLVFVLLITSLLQLFQQQQITKAAVKGISYVIVFALFVALLSIAIVHITLNGSVDNGILPLSPPNNQNIKFSLIPDSILTPFIENNFIQIVLLALLTAIAINNISKKHQQQASLFLETVTAIFRQMLQLLIDLLPFALIPLGIYLANHFDSSWQIARQYFYLVLGVFSLLYLLPAAILRLAGKLAFLPFYRKSLSYQFLALTTGSSKVALSKAVEEAERGLGISHQKSILLPILSTLSMPGLTAYLTVTVLYTASYHHIEPGWQQYLLILAIAIFSPLGTAGIPMSGVMVLPLVLQCFDLPLNIVPLAALFDPLINGLRTTLNLTGAVFITLLLDRRTGSHNVEKYTERKI